MEDSFLGVEDFLMGGALATGSSAICKAGGTVSRYGVWSPHVVGLWEAGWPLYAFYSIFSSIGAL